MIVTDELLKKYPIVSDQVDARELRVVLKELEQAVLHGGHGSVVEFGCYVGTTSLFISRILSQINSSITYHVFDSFEGLPPKSPHDVSAAGMQFTQGQLAATKKEFIMNYKKAGLPLPVIHKGWFADTHPADIPNNICFAFLDGDYYESIRDSLNLITPKLAPSAVIVVDDYVNEALPGAARAVDDWLRYHPRHLRIEASLAILS